MQGALQSLLVTDIVGSTRLWGEHESAMAADLPVHDEVVVGAVAAAGGRVFKHTGDGVMATFESAGASVAAAAGIQRGLAAREWEVPGGVRVRVGLHSGSVHERNGDLFGSPVNRLARLLAKCPPGAVLVSEATTALLGDGMPPHVSLRELGQVELRDVGRTEVVHCLVGEGLAVIDPAEVVDATGARGRLPLVEAELVGRSAEIAALVDALEAHALVSVVGVGGMGKTRLALETAAATEYADGAWWCDLTAATTPEAVPAAVLAALAARPSAGRSATESIVDHLSSRRALVVLDNCEHVVDAARELVGAIRAAGGETRVLATSREALGIRGEHVVPLSSLPADDAVGLFVARAVEARPDLALDEATLASVEELCVRLDGIPLAIELAAARCRSMAPAEIAARLDDRFRLLRGGRGGVERHRTLLATVEWSYSQLDDEERWLFDRLAVFAGGALIDAIAVVADVDEYDALDGLDRLIARSLVVAVNTPLGTRYRQLETLRQYAEDRLVEADAITLTRDRHLAWAASPELPYRSVASTSGESESARRCAAEVDNLRAAVTYAVASGHLIEGCRVLAGMGYWAFLFPLFETIDWLDPLLIPPEEWDDDVATALTTQAAAGIFAGRADRTTELLAAVPPAWDDHLWVLIARAFEALWVTQDFDLAEAHLDRCRPTEPGEELQVVSGHGHVFQTRAHADRADDPDYLEAALRHSVEAAASARRAGAEPSLSVALLIRGYTLDATGDLLGANDAMAESLALAQTTRLGLIIDAATSSLADYSSQLALLTDTDLGESATLARTTLIDGLQRGSVLFVQNTLAGAVERLLWAAGDHHTAALLTSYARLNITTWTTPSVVDADVIGADKLAAIHAEAAALDLDTATTIALAALDQIIAAT